MASSQRQHWVGVRRIQNQKADDMEDWGSRQTSMPTAQITNLGHSRLVWPNDSILKQ